MSEMDAMKQILESILKVVKGKMGSSFEEKPSEEMPESCEDSVDVELPSSEDSEDPMAEIERDQKSYFSNEKPKEEKKGGVRGSFLGAGASSNPFKKRGK